MSVTATIRAADAEGRSYDILSFGIVDLNLLHREIGERIISAAAKIVHSCEN
jgi:hypothetical protein